MQGASAQASAYRVLVCKKLTASDVGQDVCKQGRIILPRVQVIPWLLLLLLLLLHSSPCPSSTVPSRAFAGGGRL